LFEFRVHATVYAFYFSVYSFKTRIDFFLESSKFYFGCHSGLHMRKALSYRGSEVVYGFAGSSNYLSESIYFLFYSL